MANLLIDLPKEELVKMIKDLRGGQSLKVLPSEALYTFAAWITTLDDIVSAGAGQDCGVLVDLVKAFCKHNNFQEVRDRVYPYNMVHPPKKEKVT